MKVRVVWYNDDDVIVCFVFLFLFVTRNGFSDLTGHFMTFSLGLAF